MNNRVARFYPEQFSTPPEIIAEMALRGEHAMLNDVCLAVAIVADAIGQAQGIVED